MSSNRLNFEDWAKVHQMNLSKEHLAAEGKAIIKQLKAGMNTGRSSFTWEHLDALFGRSLVEFPMIVMILG
jgi:hypothetical protein